MASNIPWHEHFDSKWGPKGWYVVISEIPDPNGLGNDGIRGDDLQNFLNYVVRESYMGKVKNPDGSWLIKVRDQRMGKLLCLYDKIPTDWGFIFVKVEHHYGLNYTTD